MFERFRIKTALRAEVIAFRGSVDPAGLIEAELLFFEPAFLVPPIMKQERWTSRQAMVFMVTDWTRQADAAGELAPFAAQSPAVHAGLAAIYKRVLAMAEADPALTPCIMYTVDGGPVRFSPPTE